MGKKVSFDELLAGKSFSDYTREAAYVLDLIENGRVKPIKASGTNGKKPAMYKEYRLIEPSKDYSGLLEELRYLPAPEIQIDYYLRHPDIYERERTWVLSLSRWFQENRSDDVPTVSLNERSFSIWGREKFLSGVKDGEISSADILKHCGISLSQLKVYHTAEPFAYYTHIRDIPQNILILENLDPFYGMRKHLIENNDRLCGSSFGTLIYGGGKKVISMFRDFSISAEPYMTADKNSFFYVGDLDCEGIRIYESLAESLGEGFAIVPFLNCYRRMLKKAENRGDLPRMKERQNRNIGDYFLSFFPKDEQRKILAILEEGFYIPQEILSGQDYNDYAVSISEKFP